MSVYKLANTITAHAWNGDQTMVAVCENSNDVIIYSNANERDVKKWEKSDVLVSHTMVVCGIDWHPITNKIVTCSHDVNAFVWTYDTREGIWTPSLSILRINRAALKVKWSPDGAKFAVATGSKIVPVCYYDRQNDWWISRTKGKKLHNSSIVDVSWHPNSQIIATAGCDFRCKVISAYMPEVDPSPIDPSFCRMEEFGFGKLITIFKSAKSWVESVSWAPSGNALVFCAHDSTIHIASFPNGKPFVQTLTLNKLPYTSVLFMTDTSFVAAGYDFKPDIFQVDSSRRFKLVGSADAGNTEAEGGQDNAPQSTFAASFRGFAKAEKVGQGAGDASKDLKTKHHNVITDIRLYEPGNSREGENFTTSGSDGRIVLWKAADWKAALG